MWSGLVTLNVGVSDCTQGLAGWREGGCEEVEENTQKEMKGTVSWSKDERAGLRNSCVCVCVCVCVCMHTLSHSVMSNSATSWAVACQAPLSCCCCC